MTAKYIFIKKSREMPTLRAENPKLTLFEIGEIASLSLSLVLGLTNSGKGSQNLH